MSMKESKAETEPETESDSDSDPDPVCGTAGDKATGLCVPRTMIIMT